MQSTLLRDQIEVIQLQGHLNAANVNELRQQLISAVSSGKQAPLLLDMSQVESMDSAGLMVLVSALSLSQQVNRSLSLCSISASVRIILELTQLDRVFKIFANPSECEVFFSNAVA